MPLLGLSPRSENNDLFLKELGKTRSMFSKIEDELIGSGVLLSAGSSSLFFSLTPEKILSFSLRFPGSL